MRKTAEAADAGTVLGRHSKKWVGDGLVAFPQDEASKEIGSNYSLLVLGLMVHETYSVARQGSQFDSSSCSYQVICHSWSAFVAASVVAVGVVAAVPAAGAAVLEPGAFDLVNSPAGSYPYP